VTNFISELTFFFQRFDLLSAVDVLLVTMAVFFLLRLVRGTQAVALLRGMIVLVITIAVLTSLLNLPAFTWLLEALIETVCVTAQRLSDRRYGALIVIEREVPLADYKETGVALDAELSPQLLLQIFHINTPLHDGAAIIEKDRIAAAGCVMPLSSSGTLSRSTDRSMGLRHRAALGISEVSDAVSVVVSEETGGISVTHNGRMIRRLDQARLKNILTAFFRPRTTGRFPGWLERFLARTQGERESKQ
jgi:diadenylate cyclase